jgi:hypothetical protein
LVKEVDSFEEWGTRRSRRRRRRIWIRNKIRGRSKI